MNMPSEDIASIEAGDLKLLTILSEEGSAFFSNDSYIPLAILEKIL